MNYLYTFLHTEALLFMEHMIIQMQSFASFLNVLNGRPERGQDNTASDLLLRHIIINWARIINYLSVL